MSVLTSEAVVLRTWPVHEADLIVSFFARDYGKVRGVAKSALKSRKRFGGALEPMTVVKAWFAEKSGQELVGSDFGRPRDGEPFAEKSRIVDTDCGRGHECRFCHGCVSLPEVMAEFYTEGKHPTPSH